MDLERVNLPTTPTALSPMDAALDFRFDGDKYARVIIEMTEGPNDNFLLKAQAYEVDALGQLVAAPKGYPSRTRQTEHTVARSSLGNTASLGPAWVRVPPPAGSTYSADALPPGAEVMEALPETGQPGQMAFVSGTVYRWDKGVIRHVVEAKVDELRNVLKNSLPLSNLGFLQM